MKRILPFALLLLAGCSALAAVSDFITDGGRGDGGDSGEASVVKDVTDHIWLVWVVGPILLSLFFKDVREPIGTALSAFFGLWAALWHRLTGFVTKDPND